MRLFVSYSHEDWQFVENLVKRLRRAHDVWHDDRLHAGTEWWNTILEKLGWCDCFVYVLSPESLKSKWCLDEYEEARRLKRLVMPVRLQTNITLPDKIGKIQYADFAEHRFEDALIDLLSDLIVLERRLPKAPVPRTIPTRPVISSPTANLDPDSVFEQVIEARRNGDHETAVRLCNSLLRDAPDFLPEDVARLKADSEPILAENARYKEYERRYRQIGFLSQDPVTLDSARTQWADLRAEYPDIGADPNGYTRSLRPLAEILTEAVLRVLPEPFEWCEIPAGEVIHDVGIFSVGPFYMAKYPITYEQFRVFVSAVDGFHNDEWWFGLAAEEVHKLQPGVQRFKHRLHPRENVNWYDAVTFCRWLSSRTNLELRLPTEWEWQWAAQGPIGSTYPWGEIYLPGHANIDETINHDGTNKPETTSPVGHYKRSTSTFGVLDLCGNVWEWCLNTYHEPDRVDLGGNHLRVVRGGSWNMGSNYASTYSRTFRRPDFRYDSYGFRIATSKKVDSFPTGRL